MTVRQRWVWAALLLVGCGPVAPQVGVATGSPTTPTVSPSPAAVPSLPALLYRALSGSDGTEAQRYSLVATSLDGSNKAILPASSFPNPDLVRLAQSRNGRWLAWTSSGELRSAASAKLPAFVAVTASPNLLSALAVSEDGKKIAYQSSRGSGLTAGVDLYVADVHANTVRLVGSFAGPLIVCLADAAFDETAQKLTAIGCGSGAEAGLVVIDVTNGSIVSEDDSFRVSPQSAVFAPDLATVWLIQESPTESDIVRYDTASRTRQVLYRSPAWLQSDGSVAPNLAGFLILSPDGAALAFRRYPPDRIPEIYTIPSSGEAPSMLAKSSRISRIEWWSPDWGYLVVSLDASTPRQRMWLLDPRTKTVLPVDTGASFIEFLAWLAS